MRHLCTIKASPRKYLFITKGKRVTLQRRKANITLIKYYLRGCNEGHSISSMVFSGLS